MKYFSYINKDGYWCGGQLLSHRQIADMIQMLGWKHQCFVSTQEHDEEGKVIRCPIYIDIDSFNLGIALAQAQQCSRLMFNDFGVYPRVFFSGNKGFHLIFPYFIEHPRCHEIVRYYAKDVLSELSCIDSRVYRLQALLRLNNSPASKKGYYKIELTQDELNTLKPDQIRELATSQRHLKYTYDESHLNVDDLEYLVHLGIKNLPDTSSRLSESSTGDTFFPCLKSMLCTPPNKGDRHFTVFTLARFFRHKGLTASEITEEFMQHDHWVDYMKKDPLDLPRTIESVFRGISYPTGCHNKDESADLMKQHCDKYCWKNPNFPSFSLTGNK